MCIIVWQRFLECCFRCQVVFDAVYAMFWTSILLCAPANVLLYVNYHVWNVCNEYNQVSEVQIISKSWLYEAVRPIHVLVFVEPEMGYMFAIGTVSGLWISLIELF